jgi:2'-5' RNA ligase
MARLFVALRPPAAVRDALSATQGGVEGARWQDDDQLHLTLRFLGEVDPRTADELVDRLARVRASEFSLRVAGVGHFERRGRVAALWAAVARDERLAALQCEIEHAARRIGLPPEPRKFVPHVTLARLGRSGAGAGEWLARHGDLTAPPWPVSRFLLYESSPSPGGSRYTPLIEWPLAPFNRG